MEYRQAKLIVGDTILHCQHSPPGKMACYLKLTEDMPFTRPDGIVRMAQWAALCRKCYDSLQTASDTIVYDKDYIVKEGLEIKFIEDHLCLAHAG